MVERPRAAVAQVWNEAPEGTPVGTSTEPEHRTLSPVDARGNGLAGSPRLLRHECVAAGHMTVEVRNGEKFYKLTDAGTRYVETELLPEALRPMPSDATESKGVKDR